MYISKSIKQLDHWLAHESSLLSGRVVFELKATYGLPFEIIFSRVITVCKRSIDWVEFIETARENGWWDFKTIEAAEYGLKEALVDPGYAKEVIDRMKIYILKHPLKR